MADKTSQPTLMEKLVSLCKRRGFVYPASEIYGGLNGFWDYGPLGVQLKNNIRDAWWRTMVQSPPAGPDGRPVTMVGLDSAIIQNPRTWVSSGHVAGFADPMVDCRETKQRYRADHIRCFPVEVKNPEGDNETTFYIATVADEAEALESVSRRLKKLKGKVYPSDRNVRIVEQPRTYMQLARGEYERVVGPDTSSMGTLTEPRDFNLMFQTHVGALRSEDSLAYLRPETAQGIFLNYRNVLDTMRVKIPFGIAQIGKSFRNEVTPRNFIYRSREFEQMEMEWFCHADEAPRWFEYWVDQRMKWYRSIGIGQENLRVRKHETDELSHYAKQGVGTVDIEYRYPFTAPDFGELEGIAHRADFDLRSHQEASGQRMEYFDDETKQRFLPHVIEPAGGLTRTLLVVLCEAYAEEEVEGETRTVLRLAPQLAPVKVAVFPLVRKDGMPEKATAVYDDLRTEMTAFYDEGGAVGRRYRRQDEVGTPFCVTIDGQTSQDNTVTVRHRDSMVQERVNTGQLKGYMREKLSGA
jgi:glycyl-tRNA synthetase